jgi:hypothetical protein
MQLRSAKIILVGVIFALVSAPNWTLAKNLSADAWKDCQSSDVAQRLSRCTTIINHRGFGSRSKLAQAYDGRCLSRHMMSQYELAIPDCEAAIALQSSYFYAYNNLGTIQAT